MRISRRKPWRIGGVGEYGSGSVFAYSGAELLSGLCPCCFVVGSAESGVGAVFYPGIKEHYGDSVILCSLKLGLAGIHIDGSQAEYRRVFGQNCVDGVDLDVDIRLGVRPLKGHLDGVLPGQAVKFVEICGRVFHLFFHLLPVIALGGLGDNGNAQSFFDVEIGVGLNRKRRCRVYFLVF